MKTLLVATICILGSTSALAARQWTETNPNPHTYIPNRLHVAFTCIGTSPYIDGQTATQGFVFYVDRKNSITGDTDHEGGSNALWDKHGNQRIAMENSADGKVLFSMIAVDDRNYTTPVFSVPLAEVASERMTAACVERAKTRQVGESSEVSLDVDLYSGTKIEYSYPTKNCSQQPHLYGPFDIPLTYEKPNCAPISQGTLSDGTHSMPIAI